MMHNKRGYLDYDWYDGGIPANVKQGNNVYIDSSYAFAAFASQRSPGLMLGRAAGVYDRSAFIVGMDGQVAIGDFTCLNAAYIVCQRSITIGSYCLLAWGVVISDCWLPRDSSIEDRRNSMIESGASNRIPIVGQTKSVVIEDNVWIGFDAVVLPGVRLGKGCVIGCRTVIEEDVPPYAIVVGDPPRIVRYLSPSDTSSARELALKKYIRAEFK